MAETGRQKNEGLEEHRRKIEDAHSKMSPVAYFLAVSEAGVGFDDVDRYLFDMGRAEFEQDRPEKVASISSDGQKKTLRDKVEGNTDWTNLTRIALRRFPELEKGEHILSSELKGRLKAINLAGYDIKPCGHMRQEQLWEYLREVRSDITAKARIYCPDVLEQVTEANERRRQEARDIR